MNGTVGGYCGPKAGGITSGKTYRTPDFRPMDIIIWEQNETDGFFFNDLGNNPEAGGEAVSQRHAGKGDYNNLQNKGGGAMIGRVSGTAEFIKLKKFEDSLNEWNRTRQPNDFFNGPGYGGP
jgi:hypothetical protein